MIRCSTRAQCTYQAWLPTVSPPRNLSVLEPLEPLLLQALVSPGPREKTSGTQTSSGPSDDSQRSARLARVEKVYLYWATKDRAGLTWFRKHLSDFSSRTEMSPAQVRARSSFPSALTLLERSRPFTAFAFGSRLAWFGGNVSGFLSRRATATPSAGKNR